LGSRFGEAGVRAQECATGWEAAAPDESGGKLEAVCGAKRVEVEKDHGPLADAITRFDHSPAKN
jgi:hypothetical protein